MKFNTVLTTALLAGAAVAAPLTEKRAARQRARMNRRSSNRSSNPPFKPGTSEVLKLTKDTSVEYSENWAGAVLIGTGYNSVTAEFTVPTPSAPSSSSSGSSGGRGGGGSSSSSDEEYCASAWVGIDGDTCDTAILQTGVDFCVQGSSVSFDAWYEWYPDYAYDFDLTISAGDVVKVTVDATSDTAGTATVENVSTGESVTHTFSGETDGSLCEYNAEWIVEDFEEGDSLVAFADFGTVTFSSASAGTTSGDTVGPADATLIDIEQDSVLTSVSVTDDSVTVTYV
ncbi:hypothetical protein ASPZODRAFT_146979 [Penicilliopsis zonata CBS 506.65]|uniref:Aspergillopepsin n=1 Tax=Penicilliopsis zonata CBS 506.65 TaxID=1073090 RepID=A0A1L9S6N8_9EURO|nr:hypothetical protein ASPZODRAFT_146979 [Penicilliopsis zonata CBS 506.65]OJJ42810.1 hypothetical protein ASPZODRAFT_146979 [Penicilliopsis zonata CBS 506.65]